MEQKRFSGEVRKHGAQGLKGWEDETTEEAAETFFEAVQKILKKHGIDFTKCKVLELGSGNAKLLDYAKSKDVNIVGVDARPRGSKESRQVRARIEQLPFADESFEVIVSISVFDQTNYNQEQNYMMNEINRVLKHGGIYIGLIEQASFHPISGFEPIPDPDKYKFIYRKT